MKIAFGCLLLFICGLTGGVLFSCRHVLLPTQPSAPQSQAFDRWQEAVGPDGQVAPKTREELLPQMARSDGPRAWKVLTQTAVKPRMADMQQIAREWARQDGRAAVAFGQMIPDAVERKTFLAVAYPCWFGLEPQAFVAWLKTQPDKEPIMASISFFEYGPLIPREVSSLDALGALYEGTVPRQMSNLVMRVWERGHQNEAVKAWLRRQPESAARDSSWREIAHDLAATDPAAAAALAVEVTSPEIHHHLCSTVAAWMAKADPDAAQAYVQTLPDDPGRQLAWSSAMGTWMMHDPAAVLAHLKAHQHTLTTDKLEPTMGTWMAWLPVESLEFLRVMQGPEEKRQDLVEYLLREWRDHSRDDLTRWLDSPAAAWLTPEKLKRYRQLAETPQSLGGSGSRTIQGRRVYR